jgi:long-chain acyl-CoA synthetase
MQGWFFPLSTEGPRIRQWRDRDEGHTIHEFYAGTEFNGMTAITPEERLARPGSVGRSIFGTLHICSEVGEELPAGQVGLVRFEGATRFIYHSDPATTAEANDRQVWSTLGDVGRVDEGGYLYLTDRQSFMTISSGVNIYPQEIENVIINHPQVADVAVIGAPDEGVGERLVVVVQPVSWGQADDALAEELKIYVSARLSRIKTPRQFDFVPELPRHATGKLYKRLLRDQYWRKDKVH